MQTHRKWMPWQRGEGSLLVALAASAGGAKPNRSGIVCNTRHGVEDASNLN